MFDIIHLWSHLVLDFGLLEDLIAVSISILVINLFIFSIYSCFSLGSLYLCTNLSISSRRSILLVYSCLWWSLMIFSISVLSILTSPFSFIILLIWVLSLSPFFFFLMSLAKDLSILFIFSRYLLLLSLILAILLYISFISALICIIYFLLLTLGFVCSSFSSCFKCKVRCYWDFLFLEVEIILLLTSLLALLLIYPIGFGSSCFHCHLSLGIFWFPLQVLHWSIGYLVTYCLAFMCLSVLQFWFFFFFSPYTWFIISKHCGQNKCLIWF